MATYTIDQYVKKLQNVKIKAEPFYNIANELIGRVDNRVFNKGIGGNGRRIGTYSKEPAYFSISGKKNKARNLSTTPRGKKDGSGKKFLNGQDRKSVFMKGGYDEFKSDVGKNTAGGSVNLWLSGQFRRAWQNSNDPLQQDTNGFSIKFSIKTSEANDEDKVNSIIKRYPEAFKLTKGEKKYIVKRFEEELIKQII